MTLSSFLSSGQLTCILEVCTNFIDHYATQYFFCFHDLPFFLFCPFSTPGVGGTHEYVGEGSDMTTDLGLHSSIDQICTLVQHLVLNIYLHRATRHLYQAKQLRVTKLSENTCHLIIVYARQMSSIYSFSVNIDCV